MQTTCRHIVRVWLLLAAALTLGGCSDRDHDEEAATRTATPDVFLTLTLEQGATTRAGENPAGGEEGDGREAGVNHENDIHRLTLFFYKDSYASGIDASGGTVSLVTVEVNNAADIIAQPDETYGGVAKKVYKTVPINVKGLLDLNTPYHLVVVANATAAQLSGITTLASLQGKIVEGKPWTEAASLADYDQFLMASRYQTAGAAGDDPTVTILPANTRDNPAVIKATVERLAARVDIIPKTSDNGAEYKSDGTYLYPVKGTSDHVLLQGVKLVNRLSKGTYLLKHLAAATGDKIDYTSIKLTGKETSESGKQTNYVVDPYTRDKTVLGTAIGEAYYDNYFTAAATNTWTAADAPADRTASTPYILGYTQENTMDLDCQLTKYTTTLWFKAQYQPARWYKLASGSLANVPLTTADHGKTLWRYKGVFFDSQEAVAAGIKLEEGVTVASSDVDTYTGVEKFTDATCYYAYRIRHSNNNVTPDMGIMEFGIVRNNIYRITLKTFNGIGTLTPDTDNHDDEQLKVIVTVIPWEIIHHSTIYS